MAFDPSNSSLQVEMGQTHFPMAEISDSGDHKVFDSGAREISKVQGFTPTVLPNGLLNSPKIFPAVSGSDDVIDYDKIICNLNGVGSTTVNAGTDLSITRGGVGTEFIINSITVNAAGAVVVVTGTGDGTEHSEVRDAAGGPPLIPVDSIEIAQVRTSSDTAAVISVNEIKMTPGVHRELANMPQPRIDYIRQEKGMQEYAGVTFPTALPTIHTAGVAKKVYMECYAPEYAEIQNATNLTPPNLSVSVSSEPVFQGEVGSRSTSVGAGNYEFFPDSITDQLYYLEGEDLWHRYYPDKMATSKVEKFQGVVTFGGTYTPGQNYKATASVGSVKKSFKIHSQS